MKEKQKAKEKRRRGKEEIIIKEEEVISQRPRRTPYVHSTCEVVQHRASGRLPHRVWSEECNEVFGREPAPRVVQA